MIITSTPLAHLKMSPAPSQAHKSRKDSHLVFPIASALQSQDRYEKFFHLLSHCVEADVTFCVSTNGQDHCFRTLYGTLLLLSVPADVYAAIAATNA